MMNNIPQKSEPLETADQRETGMPTRRGTIAEYFFMCVGHSFFCGMCALWLPFALLCEFILPKKWGKRFGRLMTMFGFRLYLAFLQTFCKFSYDTSELRALRAKNQGQPLIVVANHPSLIDALLVISCFPNVVCVMKQSVLDKKLLSTAARLAGYISNSSLLDLAHKASAELKEGAVLFLFPEGTRTSEFPIGPMSRTAALIAHHNHLPLHCLLIEYSAPYLGKWWPRGHPPPLPLSFRVRIGCVLRADDSAVMQQMMEAYYRREL